MIVAHRGASKDAPENTIPAFKLAWEQGADVIEGDFQLTKDGHIVCIHDKDTKRVAGKKLVVKDATLVELRALDVGAGRGAKFRGTPIPTIAEVFATIPKGKKIYIEVKCGPEIIPALLKSIKSSKLTPDQIVVISFNKNVLRELKAKAPACKVSWLCSVKAEGPKLAGVLATLKQIKSDGFSFGQRHVDQEFIKGIQKAGYGCHVWTVDDAKTAGRFQSWGVKSITTNIPGRMRKELEDKK